jgi:hypothetical protein
LQYVQHVRKRVASGTGIVSSRRGVCVDGCCVDASGLSLLAEKLSAFQGGLSCVELFREGQINIAN